jgi:tRNA(His) 5'-end guanylyltransferase
MATSRKDALGDRMKRYEETTKFTLPRRTYDVELMECMDAAAIALCEQISGTQFAYVQSDEISLLATDFTDTETQSWFDGNVQKWASVGAAIATMAFNNAVREHEEGSAWGPGEPVHPWYGRKANAVFDARVFTIPDLIEVENYFVWRQQDAERNSVMMLARAYASHKALAGKNRAAQHEIIHKAGDNWAKHPARFKHGGVIRRAGDDEASQHGGTNWLVDTKTPVFTRNGGRAYLRNLVPVIWNDDLLVRKATANG